jgi:hypothetical protein
MLHTYQFFLSGGSPGLSIDDVTTSVTILSMHALTGLAFNDVTYSVASIEGLDLPSLRFEIVTRSRESLSMTFKPASFGVTMQTYSFEYFQANLSSEGALRVGWWQRELVRKD